MAVPFFLQNIGSQAAGGGLTVEWDNFDSTQNFTTIKGTQYFHTITSAFYPYTAIQQALGIPNGDTITGETVLILKSDFCCSASMIIGPGTSVFEHLTIINYGIIAGRGGSGGNGGSSGSAGSPAISIQDQFSGTYIIDNRNGGYIMGGGGGGSGGDFRTNYSGVSNRTLPGGGGGWNGGNGGTGSISCANLGVFFNAYNGGNGSNSATGGTGVQVTSRNSTSASSAQNNYAQKASYNPSNANGLGSFMRLRANDLDSTRGARGGGCGGPAAIGIQFNPFGSHGVGAVGGTGGGGDAISNSATGGTNGALPTLGFGSYVKINPGAGGTNQGVGGTGNTVKSNAVSASLDRRPGSGGGRAASGGGTLSGGAGGKAILNFFSTPNLSYVDDPGDIGVYYGIKDP